MYRAGLSSTEIIALKGPEDFVQYGDGLYVFLKGRQEPCYIPEDAKEILFSYLEEWEEGRSLFYNRSKNPLNTMYISRMMKKYCEKAKIPSYSAEAVRNCCAFNLFAYGATEEQVSDQMGRTVCQIKRYKGMGYKKNLKEIQDLTGKGKKDYKAIKEAFSKNTFYRFLNSAKTNWLRFTSLLAADIVNHDIKGLTNDSRKNVFIIDDSLFNRTSCKKTELGSKVFDHTDMHFKKGFRMLTLSWSDGNTLIPVNSCLLASAKDTNIIGPVKDFDHRTLAGKRRKLAQTKAPEAMMTLLDTALSAGLNADYVLFDSWFSNPAQVTAIHSKGMDVIAMIKKSSRIKYSYCGEQLNIKEIYSRNKKRRGRSKYLLSVDVMVGKENPIPAKIVCVRNRANRKDWLAFICTDTTLSEEEIIRIYGKRWQIEVFFKTCKSMLNLIGECHSLSYDALTAHVAIVFTRYMLLAMEQRQNEDQRTLGELFFFLVDEMADITFNRSLGILMDALMASLQEILKLSDEQLTAFATDFEARLPEYLRNALHFKAVAA